jgi:heme/copper-type cytochrome/quinol oxidase subunit 4
MRRRPFSLRGFNWNNYFISLALQVLVTNCFPTTPYHIVPRPVPLTLVYTFPVFCVFVHCHIYFHSRTITSSITIITNITSITTITLCSICVTQLWVVTVHYRQIIGQVRPRVPQCGSLLLKLCDGEMCGSLLLRLCDGEITTDHEYVLHCPVIVAGLLLLQNLEE